jgi:glycerol-3-phosphate dehydrogenase (NAD(P)+)
LTPRLKTSPDCLVISAIKGLERESVLTPLQFAEKTALPAKALVVLSGPSFSKDVLARSPVGVVAASKSPQAAQQVAELFTNDCMKVYTSNDPLGVELGGSLKNVIAVAAGVSDGMGLGDSSRAGIITRGLAEIMRLATAMGADRMTLSGLSGLGDLAMTASSDTSRNRQVGLGLGRGKALAQVLKEVGTVAEGVVTAPLMLNLAKRFSVEVPISYFVSELIAGRTTPMEMRKALLSRSIKQEFWS